MSGLTYQGNKTTLLSFDVGLVAGTSGSAAAIGGPPIAVYMLARGLTAIQTRASLNGMAFIKEGISAISIFLTASVGLNVLVVIVALFLACYFSVGSVR